MNQILLFAAISRARDLFNAGHTLDAAEQYRAVLKTHPENLDALLGSGTIALMADDGRRAYKDLSKANAKLPDQPFLLTAVGAALRLLGRLPEAERFHVRALAIDPAFPDAHYNLGRVYFDTGHKYGASSAGSPTVEAARKHFERFCELRPTSADGLNQLGATLIMLDRNAEAEEIFRRAIALHPTNAAALENLSQLHANRGDDATAEAMLDLSIAQHQPDSHRGRVKRAIFHLKRGRFTQQAWDDYEFRFLQNKFPIPITWIRWDGGNLRGRTLVVIDEQGPGDSILYASMIPALMARAALEQGTVILFAREQLADVYRRSFPGLDVQPINLSKSGAWPRPDADYQIPIGCLAKYFTGGGRGYIKADKTAALAKIAAYRTLARGRRIVGISWKSGAAELGTQKSTPLEDWRPILDLPGYMFVSLQYGNTQAEVAAVGAPNLYVDSSVDPGGNLAAFVAQVAACESVVTTSNTAAHVAAALGLQTRIVLPNAYAHGSIWYWGIDGARTPWYPAARLHRAARDVAPWWPGPLADVAAALAQSPALHSGVSP